jgi:hypothetical protein
VATGGCRLWSVTLHAAAWAAALAPAVAIVSSIIKPSSSRALQNLAVLKGASLGLAWAHDDRAYDD